MKSVFGWIWACYVCPHHTIIRAAFLCLWVCGCVPCLFRGPLTDLRQTWWVYVGGPRNCPWGVLFRKGQRVDGSTGHFRFPLYYIGTCLTPHSCKRRLLLLVPQLQSLFRCLLLLHINGICRWTSQLLLRGSFSKKSTGQWATFTFTILYMIADDTRLTPLRCKKHTAGSTGRRVNGSTGQRVKQVDGSTGHFHFHFHFHYIIYDSRWRQTHATLLQKAHGASWHQAHATPLQKARSIFCLLDG